MLVTRDALTIKEKREKECAGRHTETGMITREDKGSAERQMEEWMCSHQKSNMQIIRERNELVERRRDAIRETLTPRKEWITREKKECADHGTKRHAPI